MNGKTHVNGFGHQANPIPNGSHSLNGDTKEPILMASQLRDPEASPEDARTIQTVRGLILDCVEQYENGHGGDQLLLLSSRSSRTETFYDRKRARDGSHCNRNVEAHSSL